jgi:selenophosphate synthetase-related protein
MLCIVPVCSQVLGGQLVTDLQPGADGRSVSAVVTRDVATGSSTTHECDAVVFAIGITGMQKLVQQCRLLGDRQEFRKVRLVV